MKNNFRPFRVKIEFEKQKDATELAQLLTYGTKNKTLNRIAKQILCTLDEMETLKTK